MKDQKPLIIYKSVILAGGSSRRMGHDKALIEIEGKRLIDIVFMRISTQCKDVLISGTQNYGLDVDNIPDIPDSPKGPVGGLYTLWKRFETEGVDGFITVPVDGPNLPLDFCTKMVGDKCAVSQTPDGLHPTFAYWNVGCLTKAFASLDLKQSQSLKSLAKLCNARKVMWPDQNMFYNINTPHDIAEWTGFQCD